MRCGFIGLGAMGAPMARNLHRAGYLYRVWNRSPDRAQQLATELGVECATDPAALARDCEVIFTCVSADADLQQVLEQCQAGLQAGSVVIDTSTVAADTAREVAHRLKSFQVDFLDAPVSGGVEGARNAQLVMMVGGEQETLMRVLPALEAMAAKVVQMGPVGSGQATKAVNQLMAAGINQAVTESLAFGKALGLDMKKVIDVIGGGAAGNWFLQHRGHSMLAGDYPPGFKLALHHKDLEICRRMAQTVVGGEGRLPLIEMTLIHYQRLLDAGYGEEDISALFREKAKLFALQSQEP